MPIAGAWYTRIQYTTPETGLVVNSLAFPTDSINITYRRVAGRSMAESGMTEELLTRVDFFVTLGWNTRPAQIQQVLLQMIQYVGWRPVVLTLDYLGTHDTSTIFHTFNSFFNAAELQTAEWTATPVTPKLNLFNAQATFRQGSSGG